MGIKTLHLVVDVSDLHSAMSQASLSQAAQIIQSGGTVAFPTETVYGLGANALDEAAISRIFEAKRRPSWDPLIVHISDYAMLDQVASSIPASARSLMDAFWPGPLTLLLPKHQQLPAIVTAGRPRVGVRMPAHPVALDLLRRAGVPIAAPSANLFGHISPTSAVHVLDDLDGRIDAVLDGGETQHGLESTVVDTCESPVVIYRPGVITLDQIEAVCGQACAFTNSATPDWRLPGPQSVINLSDGPRATISPSPASGPFEEAMDSPGMSLRHYAPRARLVLIEEDGEAQQSAFYEATARAQQCGERVGLMLPIEFERRSYTRLELKSGLVYRWGHFAKPQELAQRLFAGLRQLDAAGATVILCPLPPESGLGVALRDRLRRASR